MFYRSDNLKSHIKRQHPDQNDYKKNDKEDCLQKSDSQSNRKRHGSTRLTSQEKTQSDKDNSHIVGHINQDGSIRPVSTNVNTPDALEQGDSSNIVRKSGDAAGETHIYIQSMRYFTKTVENPDNPGTTEEVIVIQTDKIGEKNT